MDTDKDINEKIEELRSVMKAAESDDIKVEMSGLKSTLNSLIETIKGLIPKQADPDPSEYNDFVKEFFKKNPNEKPGNSDSMKKLKDSWEEHKKKKSSTEPPQTVEAKFLYDVSVAIDSPDELSIDKMKEYIKGTLKNVVDVKVEKRASKENCRTSSNKEEIAKTSSTKEGETPMDFIKLEGSYTLRPVEGNVSYLQLFDGETAKGVYVNKLDEQKSLTERVEEYKSKIGIFAAETKPSQPEEPETPAAPSAPATEPLEFQFSEGDGFEDSTLKASQGKDSYEVTMEEILPDVVKEAILRKDPHVIEPEDMIVQLKEKCATLSDFVRWAKKRQKKNKMKKLLEKEKMMKEKEKEEEEKEKKEKKASETVVTIQKKSDMWSLNKPEMTVQPHKEAPTTSVAGPEAKADSPKPTTDGGGAVVKKYLNRLPSKSVGEEERALRPGESKVVDVLKQKLEEKEAELKKLTEEKDKKEKVDKIYQIVADLKLKNFITEGAADDIINSLKDMDLAGLEKVHGLVSKMSIASKETPESSDGNIPFAFETVASESEDVITKLSKIWNK